MWVVKDQDTTIYLFGTFHVLDGKSDWFNDEVKQAFDRSNEVVLEALIPEDMSKLGPIMAKYAVDPSGKPLTKRLSPAAQEKLVKILSASGVPAAVLDKMTPGFAGMTLALIPYQAAGMTAEHGTEATLTKAAKAANKPLGELEGIETQLKMIGQIPESAHLKSLEDVLARFEELPGVIADMKVNWNTGNAEGFAKLMNEMQASSPETYKVLLTDRNAQWAEWIDQRLDRPGTVSSRLEPPIWRARTAFSSSSASVASRPHEFRLAEPRSIVRRGRMPVGHSGMHLAATVRSGCINRSPPYISVMKLPSLRSLRRPFSALVALLLALPATVQARQPIALSRRCGCSRTPTRRSICSAPFTSFRRGSIGRAASSTTRSPSRTS